jgi:branched-chain amino acid transport system ATP-binding protein
VSVLLETVGLSKSFAGVRALSGVDWGIRQGEVWGVVGPNGSGKTTLFNTISGYHRPTAGRIVFDGAEVGRLPMRSRARRGLARTFQHAEVFGSLTVEENVAVACRRTSRGTGHVGAAVDAVGLGPELHVPAAHLSFGRRRLLGVAMAAATRPALLLLDEPTSGLNDAESAELSRYLTTLRAEGLTLAIIDHHMDFLLPLCDRMLLLRTGESVWDGTTTEFPHSEVVLRTYLGMPATPVNSSAESSQRTS